MQNFTTDNLIVVIDLGTSSISGVAGRKDYNGRVEIIASESVASKGIKRGAICNLEEAAFCIKSILSLLQNKVNILFNEGRTDEEKKTYEISGVYVGLNGQTIKTMDSRVPRNLGEVEVTQDIIDTLYRENRNIKIENGEILEIVTQEYLVDDSDEVSPVGCICTRIEGRYKIVAGRPSLKSNLYKCFEKAGYEVAGIFLSPIATASAILSKEEKELGCVMIDFGAGTTSVAVYYKNMLRHISVIPFGSDIITKDIMDLKVLEVVAEKLKVKYGSAMEELVEDFYISTPVVAGKEGKTVSNKFLAGIIEARIEEILDYVCDQIEKSGLACHMDEIVITGGGSQLLNLIEKLKLRTGLDVRIGLPNQKIAPDMEEKYLKVEYAQLIGLLIHAEMTCMKEKTAVQAPENNNNTTSKNEKESRAKKTDKSDKKGLWGSLFDKIDEIFTEDSKI